MAKSLLSPEIQANNNLWVFLPGSMTISTAKECKLLLDTALEYHGDIEVDLSAIEVIDAAGLQLLVSTKLEAEARGKHLYLTYRSPAVSQALEFTGLQSFFSGSMH